VCVFLNDDPPFEGVIDADGVVEGSLEASG
jgi:hypothetical protein